MKLISPLSPYVFALILTLIIEGILCWLLLHDRAWLKFVCLVNLFTNPLVNALYAILYWFLAKQGLSGTASLFLLGLEILVWLFEAWLFYRFSNKQKPLSSIYKVLLFSLVLNAATYLSGLLLQL